MTAMLSEIYLTPVPDTTTEGYTDYFIYKVVETPGAQSGYANVTTNPFFLIRIDTTEGIVNAMAKDYVTNLIKYTKEHIEPEIISDNTTNLILQAIEKLRYLKTLQSMKDRGVPVTSKSVTLPPGVSVFSFRNFPKEVTNKNILEAMLGN